MNDDATLLRRFAEEGAEDAFAELVQRHLDLVYGAALRRTGGDAHAAADVAQQVFTALARQAPRLVRHTVLSAWLHTATRNIALNLVISEQRRKAREQVAVALDASVAGATPFATDWEQVRPALDAAIDELPESDRAAVVLRFLDRRSFGEIGAALQISADAARMRTDRALDKLRDALGRRGITSTATALGALVTAHSAVSAPAGLAATLVPAALGAGSVVGLGAAGAAAAGLFLVNTKAILTLTGLCAALAVGYFAGQSRAAPESQPQPQPSAAPEQARVIADLRRDNQALRTEIERLNTAAATMRQPAAPAAPVLSPVAARTRPPLSSIVLPPEVVAANQRRAMLNNLRQLTAARDQFQIDYKRLPTSLDELVGVDKYVRQVLPVAGESYLGLSLDPAQPMTVTLADGSTFAYGPNGKTPPDVAAAARKAEAEMQRIIIEHFGADFVYRVNAAAQKAGEVYRESHEGKPPPNTAAALPYFVTPQEAADYLEFEEAMNYLKK